MAAGLRKPSQQRQNDDAEDRKENHFPEDVQQKQHWSPPLGVVAVYGVVSVSRPAIRTDCTLDPICEGAKEE